MFTVTAAAVGNKNVNLIDQPVFNAARQTIKYKPEAFFLKWHFCIDEVSNIGDKGEQKLS